MSDARKPKKKDYKQRAATDPDSHAAKDKRARQNESAKSRAIPEEVSTADLFKALATRGAIDIIKVQDLCNSLVKGIGGVDQFTKEFWSVYENATSGFLKARLLEGLLKMINQVHKEMGGQDPADQMSDVDLQREIDRLADRYFGGVSNGQPRRAADGHGIPAVSPTDVGVGEAAVGSPEPVRAPPEAPSVP